MSGSFPGISIVITSFNYARFIGRAIASACAQEAPELEIVVTDNASTDGSWGIIEEAAAGDQRIRAYRNETNIGMVANHTRGLELATKPRVLYLSADDYLLPGHIARVIAAHMEHPAIDYVFTAYVHVSEDDRFLRYLGHIGHPRGSYFGGRNEFADLLTYDCYACTATTLFHRDDLLKFGHDSAIIAGDYDLYLRLASSGATFGFIDQAGAALRIHPAEITGEARYMATGKQLLDQLAILEKHLTPQNKSRLAGREQGVAQLVSAKVTNLHQFPETSASVMAEAQPRIDAIMSFLNESRRTYAATALVSTPPVTVVLVTNDDLDSTLRCIQGLANQTYQHWELVLVTNATLDATPLLLDRARNLRVSVLHHGAPRGRAASLNDGLTLANGEIVTYADPESEWSPSHLERAISHYTSSTIEALVVSSDYVARDGTRASGFLGSPIAQATIGIGEGVPLSTFSHRRSLIDRFGKFDERLTHLVDFEFIARIFGRVNTGLDDVSTVVIHANDSQSTLGDPNGYLASLRALYESSQAAPETVRRRKAHFALLSAAFEAYARGAPPEGEDLATLTRGLVTVS